MDNWNRMGLMSSNSCQTYRDIQANDECMSGRYEMSLDLQNLVVKYMDIEKSLDKERNSKFCQASTVARMEKVLEHLRQTLARKGIDINDPCVRANAHRTRKPCFRCAHSGR